MTSLTESTVRSTRVSDLLFSKVPQVTLAFWIIKVFSTTVGETAADFFNVALNFGLTVTSIVFGILLLIALGVQFRTKRYSPTAYWIAVVLISVVGTLITDNLTDVAGVPLWISTTVFASLLTVTFVIWFLRERTLSIHSIVSRRREAFYWLAILFTFALGTAAGDLLAEGLGLGFLVSAILFAAVIGVVTIAFFVFQANAVVCFWIAYVLTRPLGASLGDLTSQPVADGGLGWGTAATSAVFLIVIVGLVVHLTMTLSRQRRALASETSATAIA
ncbi:hypothetical protein [Cryobacterium sp. CG_9.6]|uniref:COG4705 family protein n=1 Tax=Cryobacterium sp. CG_9.6 TaxID=2760710 RepID=UPI002473476E|nr:hypothetical protein [Cryobacterium sp. CG_9.6]MDH6238525.1 putative membrane-anchored protein [Cryobacterium sp. CG_9.6]